MSRCFPFPPPGYEKKRKAENLDLLTKEKRKEKKHKKEKKDREKREHREKRDKDRSKEKHRDKKDRKERHKHRKKDKDKKASEDNSSRAEAHTAPKADDGRDSKLVVELGRRTGDDAAANQTSGPSPIGKFDRPVAAFVASSQEKERRIPEKKTLPVHILASPDPTRNHGLSRSAQAFPAPVERGKIGANAAPQSQRKNDVLVFSSEIAPPLPRPRAAVGEIFRNPPPANSDHRKNPSVFQPGKGKNAGDMAAATAAAKTEESEIDASRSFGKLSSSKPLAPHKSIAAGIIRSAVDETTKSGAGRKINGFLQESDAGFINRMSRASPPSQLPPPASGREPNPHLFASSKDADRTTTLERRVNGIAKPPHLARPHPPCEMRPPLAENGVLPPKPPHPDSKFLDRVYAVPKVDPFSDGDDQGWLFGDRREEKRGSDKRGSEKRVPPIQVWAEAVQIDSADCFALPYVVPY